MKSKRDIAIDLMDQQKFAEASRIFVQLIAEDQSDWSLHYMAGQCFRFEEKFSDAIYYLSTAAELNPYESATFLALGIVLQLSGDYTMALIKLKYAVELDPKNPNIYNSIGLTYRIVGNYPEAIEWYSKAVEILLSEASAIAKEDKEKCYKDEVIDGKKVRTILPYLFEKIHEVLRSNPMYAIIKNNIGVCLAELGDLESACKVFKESIEFIPEGYDYSAPYNYLDALCN